MFLCHGPEGISLGNACIVTPCLFVCPISIPEMLTAGGRNKPRHASSFTGMDKALIKMVDLAIF
jgi:hypothetical protein